MARHEITQISFSRETLKAMDRSKRALLLLLGSALNDLRMLSRFSFAVTPENGSEATMATMAAFRFNVLLLMIGHLHETNARLKKVKPFWAIVEGNPKHADRWESVEENFRNGGLFTFIRNNFSFHLPNDKFLEKSIPDGFPDIAYMLVGELGGNFFAQFAEETVFQTFQNEIRERFKINNIYAFDTLVLDKSRTYMLLLSGVLIELMERNIPSLDYSKVALEGVEEFPGAKIHPFVSVDGKV